MSAPPIKGPLKANRELLMLTDRLIARLRANNGDLAVGSFDPDSFLSYMLSFVGADEQSGIDTGTASARRTVSGSAQIDSDCCGLSVV